MTVQTAEQHAVTPFALPPSHNSSASICPSPQRVRSRRVPLYEKVSEAHGATGGVRASRNQRTISAWKWLPSALAVPCIVGGGDGPYGMVPNVGRVIKP